MSSLAQQTRQLERVIRRKEKIFLMEQYAASMLQQLEPLAGEGAAEEQVIDALRIAYRYVNPELGNRVSDLLVAYGFTGDLEAEREAAEEAEAATYAEEAEEEEPPPTKKGRLPRAAGDGPPAEGEEDEEAGVLFERDIYTGRKGAKKRAGGDAGAQGGEVADLFADEEETGLPAGDADDLFADEDETGSAENPRVEKKARSRRGAVDEDEEDAAELFADEDEEDAAELFADGDQAEENPKGKARKKAKSRRDGDDEEDAADLFADEDQEDAADLFADEDQAEENPKGRAGKKASSRRDGDDEEDAGGLFADEDEEDLSASSPKAAAKRKGKGRRGDAVGDQEDAADLFDEEEDEEPASRGANRKGGKAPTGAAGRPGGGEDETEEDEEAGALFEQDIYTTGSKKKKKKRRAGAEDQELADSEVEAAEEKDARRFKPTQGHVRKETPGFAAPEAAVERDERSRRGYDLYAPEEEPPAKEQESKLKGRKPPRSVEEGEEEEEEEEEERPTPARRNRAGAPTKEEEEEKEDKGKKAGREQAADPKGEEKKLNMDALSFQVSVEDLRTHMGITLVREDAVKLMRRWEQKSRDNSIRLLLDDPKATQHPYALVPRITRFIKDGQMVQVNVLNLVRHFFQLFENVPQVVQLKSEPFFVTEVPTLEWAIVACEALPDTLNKTVLEQRTIFGHYIQKFMGNERRVRRRVLVEALYDIIVLNMVCKEPVLRKTVDLTETRRGRQTQMCVNFGAKGIRISSIARDQRHPQMGMCPSW